MIDMTKYAPLGVSIGIGLIISVLASIIYLTAFHDLGSAFYPWAFFVFLIAPAITGCIAVMRSPTRKVYAFLIGSSSVLTSVTLLFIFVCAIAIRFGIGSIQLATDCDSTYANHHIPSALAYMFRSGSEGILLIHDTSTAIVATVDYQHMPHPSTIALVRTSDEKVLWNITFPHDTVAVAMDTTTAYIFQDGIGYFIDKHTGQQEDNYMTMDSYGINDRGFFETVGIISSWKTDGSVKLLTSLTFNGIAQGCYINGNTQTIIKLSGTSQ